MNKLREKFKPLVNGYVGSSMLTNTEYPETIEKNAEQCEQIADDFAMKFAEWLNKKGFIISQKRIDATNTSWYKDKKSMGRATSELLQYFKENVYGKQ